MVRHNLNLNQLDDHRLNKVNIKEEKKEVKIFWVTKGALPLFNIFPPLTPCDVSQTIRPGHSDVARKWERINLG